MHELRFLQKGKTFPHMSEAREDINQSGPLALQSKSLESFFEDKGENKRIHTESNFQTRNSETQRSHMKN